MRLMFPNFTNNEEKNKQTKNSNCIEEVQQKGKESIIEELDNYILKNIDAFYVPKVKYLICA